MCCDTENLYENKVETSPNAKGRKGCNYSLGAWQWVLCKSRLWTFILKLWVLGECRIKSINFVLKDSECELSPDYEVLVFYFAVVCISQDFYAKKSFKAWLWVG